MNHAAILEREGARLYRLRSYVLADIDDRWFDALNEVDHVDGLNGYCLDALDYVPCGAMMAGIPMKRRPCLPGDQVVMPRGVSAAEYKQQCSLVDELIDEILAEDG